MKKMSLKDYSRFLINEDTSDSQSEDESQSGSESNQEVKLLYVSPQELTKAFKEDTPKAKKAQQKLTLAYLLAFDLLDRRCSGFEVDEHKSLILNLKTGDSGSENEEDSGDTFIVGNSINLLRLGNSVVKSKDLFEKHFNTKTIKIAEDSKIILEKFRADFFLILQKLVDSKVDKLMLVENKAIKITKASYRKLLGQKLLTKQKLSDNSQIFDINEVIKQISILNNIDHIVGLDQGSDQDSTESSGAEDKISKRIKAVKSAVGDSIKRKENFLLSVKKGRKTLPVLVCFDDNGYYQIYTFDSAGKFTRYDRQMKGYFEEIAKFADLDIENVKKVMFRDFSEAEFILNQRLGGLNDERKEPVSDALAILRSENKKRKESQDQSGDEDSVEPDAAALDLFDKAENISLENYEGNNFITLSGVNKRKTQDIYFKFKNSLYTLKVNNETKIDEVSVSELNGITDDPSETARNDLKITDNLLLQPIEEFLKENSEDEAAAAADPKESKEQSKLDKIKPLLKEADDLDESNYTDKIDYDKIKKAIMTNRDIAEHLLKKVFTKSVSKLNNQKRQRLFAGSFATLIKINLMAILQDAQGKQGLNEGFFDKLRTAVGGVRKGVDAIGSGLGLGSTKIGMGVLDNKLVKTTGTSASIYGAVGMIGKLFGASFASSAMFSLAPAALASYATYKFITRCSKNIKREGGLFLKNPESFLKNIMEDKSFEDAVRHEVELFYKNIEKVDLEKGSIELDTGVSVGSDLLQKTNKQKEEFKTYNENIQEEIKKDYNETLNLIRTNHKNLENVIGLRNLKTVLNEIYLSLAKDLSERGEGASLENIKANQDSLNAHVIQAITKHRTITEGVLEDRITQIIEDAAKNNKGFAKAYFEPMSGAKQAKQINDLAETVCNEISDEFTGLSFENFVAAYGSQNFESLKLEWALQSGNLSLLYEVGNPNLINPNLINENRIKNFFGRVSQATLCFAAIIGFLKIFKMLKKSGNDLKAITDFNKVKDMASVATADAPSAALDAANLELDMLHKVIKLKNGAYQIFYYTNMDALKGKADALTSIIVKCKNGVPVKSLFAAHRPENILKYNEHWMSRGGIDTGSLKSGVVALKAGGGAIDVTHDPETLKVLSFAYTNLEGTVADLPLSYFTDDLQRTADAYLGGGVKNPYVTSGGGSISKADQAFMTAAEKGNVTDSAELKAILTQRLEDFKATPVWQKMPADQQEKVVKYCDSFIGLEGNKLDAALGKPPTFMPPEGTPDSMEALKSKSELLLRTKVNGQTMPKGNTGLVIAKQDLSLTDIWLASAGLTNLFHNLATYYSRKKIEPKEVAAMFREAFDPVRIVIVAFVVSLLGKKLQGQESSSPEIAESADDDAIGTESTNSEGDSQEEQATLGDGFIHNMSLKDFLFENKVTFKKARKW